MRPASAPAHVDLDDAFFAGGEAAVLRAFPERDRSFLPLEAALPPSTRARSSSSSAARVRRRTLVRWVTAAVGLSAVICAAAALRVTFPANLFGEPEAAFADLSPTLVTTARATAPGAPLAAAIVLPRDVPPPPALSALPAREPEPVLEAPLVTRGAPPAGGAAPVGVAPSPAIDFRARAQRALEEGRVADALSDARRAASAAPASADAWLLLGAAYLESGDRNAAQDAFRTCATVASTGPVRECKALTH